MSSCDLTGTNSLLVLSQARQVDANNNTNTVDESNSRAQSANVSSHHSGSARDSKRISSVYRQSVEERCTHVSYKSGVVYDGTVKEYLKSGHGTFVWPNGDKYVGDFKFNCRNGQGILKTTIKKIQKKDFMKLLYI